MYACVYLYVGTDVVTPNFEFNHHQCTHVFGKLRVQHVNKSSKRCRRVLPSGTADGDRDIKMILIRRRRRPKSNPGPGPELFKYFSIRLPDTTVVLCKLSSKNCLIYNCFVNLDMEVPIRGECRPIIHHNNVRII